MRQADGSLTPTQARVLRALNGGGMLTEQQIQAAAGLTRWTAKRTIANLTRRKLIFVRARLGRYEITRLGRNTLAAKHPNFGQLSSASGSSQSV